MPSRTPPSPPDLPRWATRAEAAQYLGVSESWLDYLIAAGTLRVYRMPVRPGARGTRRSIRIDLRDVDAMIMAEGRSS
jgi:excisionase family DNA binding protein